MAYRMGRWGSRGADASDRFIPSQSQRKRRRRLAFVPAYLCVTGATAWCLTSLVYIGGYQRPVRDLGFGRQSQASVGEDLATALTGGNLTVLDDAGQAARPSVNKTISPAPSQGIPPHPWDPFIIDPAPLIALTSRPCYFPPWTFTALCSPPETPSEIAKYGHWIRVPRDIGRKVSTTYQELYYRRSPLARSPYAITAVKVFDATQLSDPDLLAELEKGQWERASGNIRSDIWPGHKKMDAAYLFVTRAKEVDGKQVDPINEIDVIWGDEKETKPWWGFERIGGTPIYGGSNDPDHVRTEITIRRTTVDPIPKKPDLTFKSDGTFKILQIADLHFSTDKGGCRESELLSTCEEQGADATTVFWLNQLIRKERPDLVVLSGDQVRSLGSWYLASTLTRILQLNGQKTSWDQFSVLLKVGHLVGDTQTPWTAIFGNHDSEDEGLGRGQQMLIMKSMPYFVGDLGPTDDDKMGVGNYMLPIRRGSEQDEQIFALFFLDSHVRTSDPAATMPTADDPASGVRGANGRRLVLELDQRQAPDRIRLHQAGPDRLVRQSGIVGSAALAAHPACKLGRLDLWAMGSRGAVECDRPCAIRASSAGTNAGASEASAGGSCQAELAST